MKSTSKAAAKKKKVEEEQKEIEEQALYDNEEAFSEDEESGEGEAVSKDDEDEEEEILYASNEDEGGDEQLEEELDDENEKLENEEAYRELFGSLLEEEPNSDEEWDNPNRNTVGNIPMEYYDDYDHIGYNIHGEKIMKPTQKDEVDRILDQEDDWRIVKNNLTGEDVKISAKDFELIKAIIKNKFPEGYDPYQEFYETPYEDSIHPLASYPPKKANFVPSKWEGAKIRKLVQAIRKGYINLDEAKKKKSKQPSYYNLWDDSATPQDKRTAQHRALTHAPKMRLPAHIESYNPPPEYLRDGGVMKSEIEEEDMYFRPKKFDALRKVPGYKPFIRERFERCLDLYQAPRVLRKRKGPLDPKTLLPQLPSADDLRPFPTKESLQYKGHTDKIRSISISPNGRWLVSGSDDGTVRVWEVETARCMKVFTIGGIVGMVAWNPVKQLIAVAADETLYLLHPRLETEEQNREIDEMFASRSEEQKSVAAWEKPSEELQKQGFLVKIGQDRTIKHLSWHFKGDYLSSVAPDATSKSALYIHQISTQRTQNPFRKQKAKIQAVQFHPSKPYLFIATQLHIRIYNLAKHSLEKKLMPGVKWISSFDIHPGGDNLVMGSYDKRVCWFDLDLSTKPFRLLRYHKLAVRNVAFHKRYPLFASCSDDCAIHVFHGMVYNDLMKNPLIVPVKILRGHTQTNDLGILHCIFHPTQPWLFSSGADATIRLYS